MLAQPGQSVMSRGLAIPDGAYPVDFVKNLEALSVKVTKIPAATANGLRGTVVAVKIDPGYRRETDRRNTGRADLRRGRMTMLFSLEALLRWKPIAVRAVASRPWCPVNSLVSKIVRSRASLPRPLDTISNCALSFLACISCGHVGTAVTPYELRSAIERHGNELIKQHLELWKRDRYHDLPDIPEAHQAADRVAEIDGWILAGSPLEALRRYRLLTGQFLGRSASDHGEVVRPQATTKVGPPGLAPQGNAR